MYTAPGLLLWYTRIGCDAREQHKQERKTSARTLWVNSLDHNALNQTLRQLWQLCEQRRAKG